MSESIMQELATVAPRMAFAALCGAAVGWEREFHDKGAGLRTHMLIAVGACLFVLAGLSVRGEEGDGGLMRIVQGLITGIGFIGAGLIFTRRGSVHGLTTAAGVWCTAAVGGTIGLGRFLLGGLATLLVLAVVGGLKRLEARLHPGGRSGARNSARET
jgi:putative Mg2+ transporter-C (MgtC) family protein